MLRLRKQVDRIDQRLLRLLQQRTKLSGEIGRTKRRHGAEVYVPDRERALLARVSKLANGKLPSVAVSAIFREILSSSREAQGQPPIGVVSASADSVLPAARCHFGASDTFVTVRDWRELSRRLRAGKLAVGVLTFDDLVVALRDPYHGGLAVIRDFCRVDGSPELNRRLFIVKPAPHEQEGNRALILIECKPTAIAVKSRVSAMARAPKLVELSSLPGRGSMRDNLVALTYSRSVTQKSLATAGGKLGIILGVYTGESHGG